MVKDRAFRHMASTAGGPMALTKYCIYVIGADEGIIGRVDLLCEDDTAAKERAEQLLGEYAIELWQSDELLERFDPMQ
jgi:hypothetical protein